MNAKDVKILIYEGRAEIIPAQLYHAARCSNGKPARLILAVNDEIIKRLTNQYSKDRDLFALVRIKNEDARALEAGLVLPK